MTREPGRAPPRPATSTGSLASQRHPGKFPKVPGRRRGRRGSQGASRAAPGKSGLHARGEGERVLALESREGTRASRRVEEGVSRSLSGGGGKPSFPSPSAGALRASFTLSPGIGLLSSCHPHALHPAPTPTMTQTPGASPAPRCWPRPQCRCPPSNKQFRIQWPFKSCTVIIILL